MDLLKTLTIAASGLRAQAGRMRIISENIANADSTPQRADADPYRRKIPTFRSELDRSLDTQLVELRKGADRQFVIPNEIRPICARPSVPTKPIST